ncbi:hypothetical protein [Cellulomonas carbonis]|uniref:Uncharacterized protein n=1 Tax=Cellulomonas carbonis T26 TaxID=947969 RepID=A0A0A0BRH6_9CELL|nr:hypothetical protein [Cellulomonas carbonis]KGM10560.1 hypothetical protein N868_13530 [Cellulomonas carbonis T26]GGC02019.1 hypothetical protein GCM10010972_13720 [Cellulomonas carbonis]
MDVVAWVLLPAVVIGLVGMLALRGHQHPPGFRAVLGAIVGGLWRWVRRGAGRHRDREQSHEASRRGGVRPDRRGPGHHADAPDPFHVLELQMRLGFLADQVRTLETDPTIWARGRRLMATRAAYDALLAEACTLAGVDLDAATWPAAEADDEPVEPTVAVGDTVIGPPTQRPGPEVADAALLAGLLHEEPGLQRDEMRRFRGEMELAARGWSW